MTDCPNGTMRDLLPDYVHGTLSGAERDSVARHLGECASCAAEVELLRAARRALDRVPAVDVGRLARAVLDSERATVDVSRGRRSSAASSMRAAAAVAAIAAAGALAYAWSRGDDPRRPVPEIIATSPRVDTVGVSTKVVAVPPRGAEPAPARPAIATVELALGAIDELDDADLEALTKALDEIDAMPDEEPGSALPSVEDLGVGGS